MENIMMGFGLVGTIIVIALVAYLLGWRPQGDQNIFRNIDQQQPPLEILKARFSRGEIDQEKFERMRDELRFS